MNEVVGLHSNEAGYIARRNVEIPAMLL